MSDFHCGQTEPSQDKPDSVGGNQSVTVFCTQARDHFAVGQSGGSDSVLWGLWWYISPICVDLAKQEMNSPYVRLSFGLVLRFYHVCSGPLCAGKALNAVPCLLFNTLHMPKQTTVISRGIRANIWFSHIDVYVWINLSVFLNGISDAVWSFKW